MLLEIEAERKDVSREEMEKKSLYEFTFCHNQEHPCEKRGMYMFHGWTTIHLKIFTLINNQIPDILNQTVWKYIPKLSKSTNETKKKVLDNKLFENLKVSISYLYGKFNILYT